jgi:hypothetical protein
MIKPAITNLTARLDALELKLTAINAAATFTTVAQVKAIVREKVAPLAVATARETAAGILGAIFRDEPHVTAKLESITAGISIS